jgi:hypothetical protein
VLGTRCLPQLTGSRLVETKNCEVPARKGRCIGSPPPPSPRPLLQRFCRTASKSLDYCTTALLQWTSFTVNFVIQNLPGNQPLRVGSTETLKLWDRKASVMREGRSRLRRHEPSRGRDSIKTQQPALTIRTRQIGPHFCISSRQVRTINVLPSAVRRLPPSRVVSACAK